MNRLRTARRGIALVAALLTIALLALLAAGSIAAVGRVREGAALAARDAQLMAAGDYAVNVTVASWKSGSLPALRVGQSISFTVPVPGSPFVPTVSATRLSFGLFWLVADAMASDSAHRRINLVVRAGSIDLDSLASLVAAGDVSLSGPVSIRIGDSATAASCSAPVGPALVLGPTGHLTGAGADSIPPTAIARRPSASNPVSYSVVGGTAWARLEGAAAINLPGNTTIVAGPTTSCTEGATTDWGDPRPGAPPLCAQRIPLIYAAGDVLISGGVGQGVLLVQGHLHIAGAFQFTGLIVALNGVQMDADGVSIDGAVVAGTTSASTFPPVSLSARAVITGDACAVERAIATAVPPRAVHGRAWTELY